MNINITIKFLIILLLINSSLLGKKLNKNHQKDGIYYENYEHTIIANGDYVDEKISPALNMKKIETETFKDGIKIRTKILRYDKLEGNTVVEVNNKNNNNFNKITYKGNTTSDKKIIYEEIYEENDLKDGTFDSQHYKKWYYKNKRIKKEYRTKSIFKKEQKSKWLINNVYLKRNFIYTLFDKDGKIISKITKKDGKLNGKQEVVKEDKRKYHSDENKNGEYLIKYDLNTKNGKYINDENKIYVTIIKNNFENYTMEVFYEYDKYDRLKIYIKDISYLHLKSFVMKENMKLEEEHIELFKDLINKSLIFIERIN